MFDLMNEMSELIYVTDPDTYDLLFMNRAGREMFGLEELKGLKCYQAIQGRDRPCEFCNNAVLRSDGFYTWEHTNTLVNRHYLLKDKLILWDGKPAHIEVAFDTTESENKKQALKNALDAENLVNACAKLLYGADQAQGAENLVLAKIGEFLEAERTYVIEIDGAVMNNTYEWCAPGIACQSGRLQNISAAVIRRWMDRFEKQQCVLVDDLEAIRESSPAEYAALKPRGLRSLITAPMWVNGQLLGYIGADNYAVHKLKNAAAILGSLAYFFGALLRLRSSVRELARLSYYDTLTGVLNRNGYTRDLEAQRGCSGGPAGAVYVDINGMKQINDRCGHRQGDKVLLDAADKIRSLFPEDAVYRIGGDEFAVLCSGAEKAAFAARLRDLKNLLGSAEDYTASVGSFWTDSCRSLQSVIYEADERMYHEKKMFYHGRALSGRYRHSVDDILEMTKPGVLQSMLDEGRFLVYFQPKVGVWPQDVIGSEALVRCCPAGGALLQPSRFIPVLEEARLISLLDFYVFRRVCAQVGIWRSQGRNVTPVSVNFSRYTISEENFVDRLQRAWEAEGIPKHLVEIEVTETVEADDSYDFLNVMKRVKENGFSVSIDDFGVRNANLSLFTSLDFDVLKIDKSLIDDLPVNPKAQAILASIADICRKMRIRLIVEGVETQAQMDFLRTISCDGVQGYLFSRPIPLEAFEERYLVPRS